MQGNAALDPDNPLCLSMKPLTWGCPNIVVDPPASVSSSPGDQALASAAAGAARNTDSPTNMTTDMFGLDGWLSPAEAAQGDARVSMIPGPDLPWESEDENAGEIVKAPLSGLPGGELGMDCWLNPLSASTLTHPLDPD